MKRYIFLLLCALMAAQLAGQEKFKLKLWPDGAPGDNGLTESVNSDGTYFGVNDPELEVWLPAKDKANGQAIVICPGGGYGAVVYPWEGTRIAEWCNSEGIAGIILKYRLPNGNYEIPRMDVLKAVETAKDKASEWGYDNDKVGVIGFSAGGHLASTAATYFTSAENRPDFAILIYPVITMDETFGNRGTRENLLGPGYNAALVREFSNELRVTDRTPPSFIAISSDDEAVSPLNATAFYDALKAHGVPAELHIYTSGRHGWLGDFKYRGEFRNTLSRWLSEQRGE